MDAETVADALALLRAVPQWRLPGPRWEQVRLHLDRIAAGLARDDAAEVAEAVADLRLCAPTRIEPITARAGAPDEVLDRIAPLVHSLAPQPEKKPDSPQPEKKPEKKDAAGDTRSR
jgi:hypothetical protein